jgi:enoyl-CoA hydratase/carnithine racemase
MTESDSDFETIIFRTDERTHVATITLNRPEVMNAFNRLMVEEFTAAWRRVREDRGTHAVVLRAARDRAFCTGVDVKQWREDPRNPWNQEDPGVGLSPKQNRVWKPVVAAVHGMVAGGAFYWLNEADIVIASDDATFFDPHVNFGLTASLEPIGLTRLIPLQEVLRIALLGLDERVSAATAMRIGLVTEVTRREDLWPRAAELAEAIASKPPTATEGTVRAIWESLDVGRTTALERGLAYTQIGNPLGTAEVDRAGFQRPTARIR